MCAVRGLWGLAAPLLLFIAATGLVVANSIAGAVSALVGAPQYGAGIVGSGLVGVCADGTPWPLGWVVAVCGFSAAARAFGAVSAHKPVARRDQGALGKPSRRRGPTTSLWKRKPGPPR